MQRANTAADGVRTLAVVPFTTSQLRLHLAVAAICFLPNLGIAAEAPLQPSATEKPPHTVQCGGRCDQCGCKGGPGYRGPNGHCVSHKQLKKVCGVPPTTFCTAELIGYTKPQCVTSKTDEIGKPGKRSRKNKLPKPAEIPPQPNAPVNGLF